MNAFWPLSLELRQLVRHCQGRMETTFPDARSVKVSSETVMMMSAFVGGGPVVTSPFFFRSMVQTAFLPSLFVTWSSNTPLVCKIFREDMTERNELWHLFDLILLLGVGVACKGRAKGGDKGRGLVNVTRQYVIDVDNEGNGP